MKYARLLTLNIDIDFPDPATDTYRHYEQGEQFISIPWKGAEGAYMSMADGSILTYEEAYNISYIRKAKLWKEPYEQNKDFKNEAGVRRKTPRRRVSPDRPTR